MLEIKEEPFIIKGSVKTQIAMYIYYKHKQSMKNILRMGEFKYGGRKSEGYKHFRKEVMETFYSELNQIFCMLEDLGLIVECGCGHSLDSRSGYQPCHSCAGCGKKNSSYLNDAMAFAEGWTPDKKEMIRQLVEEGAKKQNISIEEFLKIKPKINSPSTP